MMIFYDGKSFRGANGSGRGHESPSVSSATGTPGLVHYGVDCDGFLRSCFVEWPQRRNGSRSSYPPKSGRGV